MLAIAGVLVGVLVGVSYLAITDGSADVAREGQIAIASEATLSSAVVTRNIAAQTLLLERGRTEGSVADDAVARAAGQLAASTTELSRRASQLSSELPTDEAQRVDESAGAFTAELMTMVEALTGPAEPGVPRIDALPSGTYDATAATLVEIRDQRVVDVLVGAEAAGEEADAVRFLVIIGLPVIAMLLVRSVMKRRRERESLRAAFDRQTAVIASKDEFVANLSHELRTPLTGVYGFALALDEGGLDDPETAKELTGLIINDASELSRMVDDLITAGQVETGNVVLDLEDVEVDDEIEAVIDPFVRGGASITFTPSGDVAEVDRLRFRQVVRNLVSNAAKHGGENIEVFTEYGSGILNVFVMDDGDGIADEQVTQLFERYQHEGTGPLLEGSVGLGLAIARSLAVAMGGNLSYTRTNGITYFVLRLPSHRVGKLNERVDQQSLGDDQAAQSATEVAKLFAR